MTPEQQLDKLLGDLNQRLPGLRQYDQYYEGEQPITFLSDALAAEFGERITALVLNWPRVVADAYESRLDVEGFRYQGSTSGDELLWQVWQANDLDEQSQQAHLESLVMGRSYAIVGAGDSAGDAPLVTVESPMQVFAARDPRSRRVSSAVKWWVEGDVTSGFEHHAVLYLPNSTRHLVRSGKTGPGWVLSGDVDEHGLGIVPVVPLVNRPRTLRPDGLSEFHDVKPVADAANKMATDMMVSGEFHAMPRRWAVGMKESDFVDENGDPLNPWSRDAGTLWATPNQDAKMGQFAETSLTNFHDTIKLLDALVVQLAALPPHYLPFTGENPTSADAIRSSETQLVKRTERKQTYLGGSWEAVQRLVLRIMTGQWDPRARSLETIWRDPSTPTVAQKADAILKLATPIQGARAIVPLEQAREDLGYTPEQRRRMADMDAAALADPYLTLIGDKSGAADAAGVG